MISFTEENTRPQGMAEPGMGNDVNDQPENGGIMEVVLLDLCIYIMDNTLIQKQNRNLPLPNHMTITKKTANPPQKIHERKDQEQLHITIMID